MRLVIATLALLLPGIALAQPGPVPARSAALYVTGAVVGNGADLTEDTLQTYTIPASTLVNVGDSIIIRAGGGFGATTDSKTARVKFGSTTAAILTGTITTQQKWYTEIVVTKTGSGTQSFIANGGTSFSGVTTQTDTAGIVVLVTGQNATNSVAGSVTCQVVSVTYQKAPGS